ncbi:MAG: penicillin acylase family protein [Thermoanaerobaculia bacterium]
MKRAAILLALLVFALTAAAQDLPNGRMTKLPGMQLPGMVTREANGIPHVFALTKHDLLFLNGWMHAQDRLFQMDTNRRIASGTLGELLGSAAISNDVQLRTFGLRRAAELSLPTFSQAAKDALQAYADGVNAYIAAHPTLPPEYQLLEITQIPAWTPVDSVAVGKLIAFGLSFDLDIDTTTALLTYQAIGQVAGFDGTKLFFNDLWRSAPFDPAATIPDATGNAAAPESAGRRQAAGSRSEQFDTSWIKPETLSMLESYRDKIAGIQTLAFTIDPERHAGSNEWAIAPSKSTTNAALIANDPHLSLVTPSTFYPISLHSGKTNVAGMGFPGAPFVIQGQNERIAWGSTVHPMDVTDIYQEQLVPSPTSPSGFASVYKNGFEPVIPIPQTYRINNAGNGIKDDLTVVTPSATVPPATLIVPRHGPIIQLNQTTGAALSIQYTGLYATHELEAFMFIDDASNVDEFKAALQYFDVGSQNFAYADIDGNIAYFTSAEMPVREDLQAGTVTGLPPYFIRNGQGGNEWLAVKNPQPQQALPFEILPYSEMPQVVNPSNGFFVNANNDPIGQTLDNNVLNTPRPGGGILYLNPGYDQIRANRITQLIKQKLAGGGKISPDDMKNIQADTALYDAQFFVPQITQAMANAKTADANPALAGIAASPAIVEAVQRLSKWDFSSPTGIAEGYDASDVNGALSTPTQAEIDNSVAATIYSMWRSRFIANTVDGVLAAIQAGGSKPPDQQTLSALKFLMQNYATTKGAGASGINFFNVPGVSDANARRDIIVLKSLGDALALLASNEFKPAFNNSTSQGDYRWGKLHRIEFSHLMGNIFSPGAPAGQPPFSLAFDLPGVPVDGGFSTVDAASHSARAATLNGFMFGSGPNRRYVGDGQKDGFHGQSSLPGGVSGIVGTPFFSNLLPIYLTNDTFEIRSDTSPRIPWIR